MAVDWLAGPPAAIMSPYMEIKRLLVDNSSNYSFLVIW
jgi:hypothetical protein